MTFRYSHIYCEGKNCADKLASHGTYIQGFSWWDLIPTFIRENFFCNRYDLPSFSFRWLYMGLVHDPPAFVFFILLIIFGCLAHDSLCLRCQSSWDCRQYCKKVKKIIPETKKLVLKSLIFSGSYWDMRSKINYTICAQIVKLVWCYHILIIDLYY